MFQRTKRLFKRSIETFKSYFSDGYQKLPKTPSYNVGFSPTNMYSEFVDQWEAADRIMAVAYENNTDNLKHKKSSMLINQHEVNRRKQHKHEETTLKGEEKRYMVTRRLKELELFDGNNVDHVLDIQEVLHYYSRLSCPTYREMVDKFMMDIYSEVLSLPSRS
ncbi:unnamed protein product [Lactuca virosa]|uniref:OVATE domain-containing protein n=1 Tax=Lactuca virosa TaxID=75947 RepID=A0AAU9PGH6_9ASTR|nr:unnamed protein product [Lactuca virosa]